MSIADLERTIDLPDMVAYAGATWDWHRLHYDAGFTSAAGLPAPVVDGQQLGALMAKHALDHFGPDAFLTALDFRLKAMVFAGDRVRVTGAVGAATGDTATVEQEVFVGERLCVTGTATVRLTADSGRG